MAIFGFFFLNADAAAGRGAVSDRDGTFWIRTFMFCGSNSLSSALRGKDFFILVVVFRAVFPAAFVVAMFELYHKNQIMFIAPIDYNGYNHYNCYMVLDFPSKNKSVVLALGAESAGNFSVYQKGEIYFSEDFGDLLNEKNWGNYQKAVLDYLKNTKIKPGIILADLHPLFHTTLWGAELSKKFKARHIPVQHHLAHVFSAIGDRLSQDTRYKIQDTIYGIAADGTGYGLDGKIWGGEVFRITKLETRNSKLNIQRIGRLENQTLLGGDLAIREPARMLISILDKIYSISPSPVLGRGCPVLGAGEGNGEQAKKDKIYPFVKKYYSRNEFELIYNQLRQNFNCQETSSAGRVLDVMSLLLDFCNNDRNYKHEPIDLLEKNSTAPYLDLKPRLTLPRPPRSAAADLGGLAYELDTTYLFNYVINYAHKKDKKRLAATAQLYLAQGLYEIVTQSKIKNLKSKIFFAGGMANNKIISDYLKSKDVYISNKIPRGDVGLSFGQAVYYLLS
jgi:hydrogenase maturation protein HypF